MGLGCEATQSRTITSHDPASWWKRKLKSRAHDGGSSGSCSSNLRLRCVTKTMYKQQKLFKRSNERVRLNESKRERTAAKTHAGSGLPFARTSIAAARRSVREPARPLRLRAPPCPPPTHLRPSRRLRGRPRRGRCRPPPRRRHRPCPFPPPPRLRPRRRHLRRHHPHRQTWT